MSTLKEMAMMNMEEILYLEGVTTLSHGLDKYLKETPVWSESRLNRISELATNLGSAKLVKQAENILTRYKEILDMLRKRQETLHRAEERLSVGATKHYLCWQFESEWDNFSRNTLQFVFSFLESWSTFLCSQNPKNFLVFLECLNCRKSNYI